MVWDKLVHFMLNRYLAINGMPRSGDAGDSRGEVHSDEWLRLLSQLAFFICLLACNEFNVCK
jgi:hypothetical protein